MAYYGPRARAAAAALPAPTRKPSGWRVPTPSPAMQGTAIALGIYAGVCYYRLAVVPPAWVDQGAYWVVPGKVHGDSTPDGAFTYTPDFRTVQATDNLYKNVTYEQEFYGQLLGIDPFTRYIWGPTQVYPPSVAPRRSGNVGVPEEEPNSKERVPPALAPLQRTVTTEESFKSRPAETPPLPRWLTRRGVAVRQGGQDEPLVLTHPLSKGPEVKTASDTAFAQMVNVFFSKGGEAIDYTRCFLGGLGFTYLDRSGRERVIPRDQWGEAIRRYQDGTASKYYPRLNDPNRPAAQLIGQCLLMDMVQDSIYAQRSQTLNAMQRDMFVPGPLGVDSLLKVMSGEIPYSNLI